MRVVLQSATVDCGTVMEFESEQEPNLPPLGRTALFFMAWLAIAFGTILVTLIVIGVYVSLSTETGDAPDVEALMAVYLGPLTVLVDAFHIGLTLGFLWFVDRGRLSDIGMAWGPGSLRSLLAGLFLGSAFISLTSGLYWVLGWTRYESQSADWLGWTLTLLLVYPAIGLAEEMAFRGYLLKNLEQWRGRGVAIAVSSVLFWVVHFGADNTLELLGAMTILVMGAMFALARYGTGSLWLPIGLHAAYDFAAVNLMPPEEISLPSFLKAEVLAEPWLVGAPGEAGLMDLIGALILLAGVYFFIYRPSERMLKPT